MNHETEYNEKNDLFYNYDKQPPELKAICDRYAEMDNDYQTCEKFLAEVQQIGYTFDYGLCGEPFNLREHWICTDPSCNQYRRRLGDNRFEFKEDRVINPETKETETVSCEIDLNESTWFEMIDACEAFGYTTKQIDKWISEGEESELIAECIFELKN